MNGMASGWTSEPDFQRLVDLRVGADALMVGRGTLEKDQMTLRAPGHPLRCVVSRRGPFDAKHPLFAKEGGAIHLLGTETMPDPVAGASVHHASLESFLQTLANEYGVKRLHCEGGGQLVGDLMRLDVVDEIHLTWAGHRLFGGHEVPGISGQPGEFMPDSRRYELTHFESRDDLGECFLSYVRRREGVV